MTEVDLDFDFLSGRDLASSKLHGLRIDDLDDLAAIGLGVNQLACKR